jgi:hypothetical protein
MRLAPPTSREKRDMKYVDKLGVPTEDQDISNTKKKSGKGTHFPHLTTMPTLNTEEL